MGYIVGPLISVPAQNSATWTQRTADISAYIGQNVRLVVLYQSGSSFTGDVQLDDFNIGGNTFDPETGTHSFQVQSVEDNSQLSNVNYIQSDYDSVTWSSLTTDGSTHATGKYGKFFRDSGGTPSGGTGNTSGNTGSFYYFAETSSTGSNNDIWIRSPEVTVNNGTLSFYTAQNGETSGPIYAYLEVTSVPVKAVYGLGRYGDSNYGKLPETVRAPLSVTKVGSIYGQQNYGGVTYGSGSISTTHSGISATGSVTTVTVTAESSLTLPAATSTASAGDAFTIEADASHTVASVLSTASSGDAFTIEADARHTVASVPSTSAVGDAGVIGIATTSFVGVQATGTVDGNSTILADSVIDLSPVDSGENDGAFTIQVPSPITNGFSPEFGLTQDFLVERTTELLEDFGRSSNVVMACEVQLPTAASVSEPKALFEHGGGGIGAYVGISKINNVYHLRIRAGEGSTSVQLLSDDTDIAVADVALSEIPEFDGSTHNVVWEFKPGAPGRVRLWIDGRNIISQETSGGGQLESAQWSGGGTGEFGGSAGPPGGVLTYDGGATQYQTNTNWPYTPGDLRVYVGELADFGTTLTITADANVTPESATSTSSANTPNFVGNCLFTLPSVSGSNAVNDVTPKASATATIDGGATATFTTPNFTIFTGVFVTFTVDGVSATSRVDDNLTIKAQAVAVPEAATATSSINDSITVEADVVHVVASIQGVSASGGAGTIKAGAVIDTLPSVQATSSVNDDLTIIGKAEFTLPSVSSTSAIDDNLTLNASATTGEVPSVSATSSVESPESIVAQANVTPESASSTGLANGSATFVGLAEFTLSSVEATATADGDSIIEADASFIVVSVDGVSATGGVSSLVAEANVTPESAVATGSSTTPTIQAQAVFTTESLLATSAANDVTVSAKATVDLDGVSASSTADDGLTIVVNQTFTVDAVQGTTAANDIDAIGNCNTVVNSVSATSAIDEDITITADTNFEIASVEATGSVTTATVVVKVLEVLPSISLTGSVTTTTITTETNIFDANNRIEKRTVYVAADKPRIAFVSPDKVRVVDIPADKPRTTYVEAA